MRTGLLILNFETAEMAVLSKCSNCGLMGELTEVIQNKWAEKSELFVCDFSYLLASLFAF